jgi:four helix bundle protein
VPRDHRKLAVFAAADQLVIETDAISRSFPDSERFGLQAQLRRAAVSIPSNIVEGSARRTAREYFRFLNVAAGSAAEAAYLVDVSIRLDLLSKADGEPLTNSFIVWPLNFTPSPGRLTKRRSKPKSLPSRKPEAGSPFDRILPTALPVCS